MPLIKRLVFTMAVSALIALALHGHVDLVGIAGTGIVLFGAVLYAVVPKIDDMAPRVNASTDASTEQLPGSPDRALIPELWRARKARKARDSVTSPHADE